MLFLVTPRSVQSAWCNYEIGAARALEKEVMIALRHIDPQAMPAGLKRFQASVVESTRQLTELVKLLLKKCAG